MEMVKKKIGDLLVEKALITKPQLDECLRDQAISGRRIGEILVDRGYITELQLIETISERLSVPKVSLGSMVIDPRVIQTVPVDIARRYSLIPIFAIGNTLTLVMADPLNIIAIDEIKYLTGKNIKRSIATTTEIVQAIDQYYSVADSLNQIVQSRQKDAMVAAVADVQETRTDSDSPIIRLVDLIISKAVKDKASDIHIEPEEDRLRIRYRISNVMKEEASPPKSMQNELISRIKISANLDVSEKRLPQDGRFGVNIDGASIDLRVSSLPTIHGEKIVIRILDRRNLLLSFGQLGFNPETEAAWKKIIRQPEGLVLISGPTSSGKTSTLYATLQEINSIEKNIITVEDPVEYSLPIINQIQINEKAGLTFPTTLRSMLRQNPDIIMIGEIRDVETARMAIRSSLTGHLVFSTIHTNDAPSAVTRLVDMGVESYLTAAAIKGVLAQRLVRTNCPNCLQRYEPSDVVLQRAGLNRSNADIEFQHSTGCNQCKNTGYHGLVGIYEYVEITPAISELIVNSKSLSAIRREARTSGYVPLFESGMDKVAAGTIRLEELLKETSHAEESPTIPDPTAIGVSNANPV